MARLLRPSRSAGISAGLGSEANTARKLAAMSSISVQVDRDRGLVTVTTLSERKSRTGKVGERETAVAVQQTLHAARFTEQRRKPCRGHRRLTGRLSSIFGFAPAAVAGISSAYPRCRKQWHRRGGSSDRRSILGFAAVAIGISVGGTARHEQREHQGCDFHDTPPRVRTNEGKSCRCVLRQIGRFTACEINSSIGLLMRSAKRSASICGPGEPFASLS